MNLTYILIKKLSFGLCIFTLVSPLHSAERVALVIGNNAYKHGTPLKNCVNDAKAVASALKNAGFTVITAEDTSLEQMEAKALEFRRAAQGAKAAWFHYSGHGAEVKGMNYLIPVDADVKEEFQVKHKAYALDQMLGAMEEAGAPLKVVVLDCCRNNPFGRGWSRSSSVGLAQLGNTPEGTIIAFATSPGKVAEDGAGANSPFTAALVKAIATPGLDVKDIFNETGRQVILATNKTQQPWVNSSFFDNFVMQNIINGNGGASANRIPSQAITPPTAPTVALPSPSSLSMPADLPAAGFFDSTQVFQGTAYADFNSTSRRQILQKAQEKLKAQNLYTGTIDGGMGPASQKAILEWQVLQGLAATGRLDRATQSSLGIDEYEEVKVPPAANSKSPSKSSNSKDSSKSNSSPKASRPSGQGLDEQFHRAVKEFESR